MKIKILYGNVSINKIATAIRTIPLFIAITIFPSSILLSAFLFSLTIKDVKSDGKYINGIKDIAVNKINLENPFASISCISPAIFPIKKANEIKIDVNSIETATFPF